jgi:hypothetical protein
MHRSRRRRLSGRSAALVALTLVAAMLAVGVGSAAGAPAAAPTIHRSVRTVTKGAAIPFPTGQTVTPIQGIQNPEIPPEPEQEGDDAATAARTAQRHRTVQHSLSHRPSAKMTAQLRAAEAAADLTVPSVTPKPLAGSNPGLDRSFEGLNFFDQRFANNGNQFSIEPPTRACASATGSCWRPSMTCYGSTARAAGRSAQSPTSTPSTAIRPSSTGPPASRGRS